MQGVVLRSICFLAFLLSFGVTQDSQDSQSSLQIQDLNNESLNSGFEKKQDDVSDERSAFSPFLSQGLLSNNYGPILTGGLSLYSPLNSFNPGFDSSYASAEANAQALSQLNSYGSLYSPGFSPTVLNSESFGSGLNFEQDQAQAHAISSGFGSNYASSDATAKAQAIFAGSGGLGLGSSPYGSGYSSAEADTQATASAYGSGSFATANSNTQSIAGGYSPYNSGFGSSFADAQANAFTSGGTAISSAQAVAGATAIPIPFDRYIIPNMIPGGENIITCTQEGGFYNVWSMSFQCLICTCTNQFGILRAICVTCDQCSPPSPYNPIPDIPTPIPNPVPLPLPLPPLPQPTPDAEVSCDPLPTNTPFQNPLNPCQICICQNSFGLNIDVKITCEEDESCVLPTDLITIPPIPDPPAPVELPMCQMFPPNVAFPHPFETCQICECLPVSAIAQHQIICYPSPECQPIPLPAPLPPPVPGPLPWPPQSVPLPPSPLPGPLPHKSCAPYPPNQQFQHPWDECQICVCNEFYSIGIINIEVNCFTSPACCVDVQVPMPRPVPRPLSLPPPVPYPAPVPVEVDRPVPVPRPYPVPVEVIKPVPAPQSVPVPRPVPVPQLVSVDRPVPVPQPVPQTIPVPQPIPVDRPVPVPQPLPVPQLVPVPQPVPVPVPQPVPVVVPQPPKYLDLVCRVKEIGMEFAYGSCRMCTCQSFGGLVVPVCRRLIAPDCVSLPAPVPVTNIVYVEPRCRYRPPMQLFHSGCHSCMCQSVFSFVIAQCTPSPGCGQSYYAGQSNLAESSASAQAIFSSLGFPYGYGNSQASAQANAAALSGSSGYGVHPFGSVGESSAFANAEANAVASPGSSGPGGYPLGELGESPAFANAEAHAAASSGSSGYGGHPLGGSSADAHANAVAFGGSLGYPGLGGSSASADASTTIHAQFNLSPYGNSYPYSGSQAQTSGSAEAQAASNLYPSLYPRPYGPLTPLYQPSGGGIGGVAEAMADASALSFSLGSQLFGNKPFIRAGPGLCEYVGDKYHHACQACYCLADDDGKLYSMCLGTPCS